MRAYPDCGEVDITWMAFMKKSEKSVIRLYERLCFGVDYDSQLRFGIRQNKLAAELFDSGALQDTMTEIDAAVAEETKNAEEKLQGTAAITNTRNAQSAGTAFGSTDDAIPENVCDHHWRRRH